MIKAITRRALPPRGRSRLRGRLRKRFSRCFIHSSGASSHAEFTETGERIEERSQKSCELPHRLTRTQSTSTSSSSSQKRISLRNPWAKNTSPDKDVEKDYFYRQFVF